MNWWQRILNLVARPRSVGYARTYLPQSQGGVTVTPDTALTLSAVWACVSVIARTMATMPWRVYEKSPAGRRELDNPLAWLLNNAPNKEMTAVAFRETLMMHVLTWGNAYAEISWDNAGRPTALWPLEPDRVTPTRDAPGSPLYYLVTGESRSYRLEPEDVLHIHGMGWDGLTGYSPVQMAARSIGIGIAQDTFGQAFYANGTVFGSVVEMPGNMNAEQIKTAEAYFNDKQRGPGNAFRVKVAPAGTKINGISMPLTDAQFLESRRFSVTEICRWYGVPPHKVADLERSTNNNIEHQGIEFVSDAIVPWAVRLEQEVNSKLIGARVQGRTYTKLDVDELMRGDAKSRADYYRAMTQMGAMSINEVREREDLNSIGSDGDVYLVQLNQTTLEQLVADPPKAGAAAPAAAPKEPAEPGEPGEPAKEPAEPGPENLYDLDDAVRGNQLRLVGRDFTRKQA